MRSTIWNVHCEEYRHTSYLSVLVWARLVMSWSYFRSWSMIWLLFSLRLSSQIYKSKKPENQSENRTMDCFGFISLFVCVWMRLIEYWVHNWVGVLYINTTLFMHFVIFTSFTWIQSNNFQRTTSVCNNYIVFSRVHTICISCGLPLAPAKENGKMSITACSFRTPFQWYNGISSRTKCH